MDQRIISIVVAMDQKRVIGKDGKIPWHLPSDLKRFRALTIGHSVIMGRKTYESIIARNGEPLPDRQNIVLTKNSSFSAPGCTVVNSFQAAVELAEDLQIFVIGGSSVYKIALSFADLVWSTRVETEAEGDIHFLGSPSAGFTPEWKRVVCWRCPKQDNDEFPSWFELYVRPEN